MTILQIIVILLLIIVLSFILISTFDNPFKYPYYYKDFDVSGKKLPAMEDQIDEFLNNGYFYEISNHQNLINEWKIKSEQKINKSKIKKWRRKQYERALDDAHAFVFSLNRKQTRYKQVNYVKESYAEMQNIQKLSYDYQWLEQREIQLRAINHETTLSKYNAVNQRKLMTPDLRKQIMIRDNYTCQYCGKYMPDEVGLHIDHIIPVSKGGKTVPSNLQVLCSKCNGSKSNKT